MIEVHAKEIDSEKIRQQMKKLVAAFLGAAEESIMAERAAVENSDSQSSHIKSTAKPQRTAS